ncbi:unnamed protein product, partial [Ectocarpus sp. 4 AP-2014]
CGSGSAEGRTHRGGGTRGGSEHQRDKGRGHAQGRGEPSHGGGSESSGSQSGRGSGHSRKKHGGGRPDRYGPEDSCDSADEFEVPVLTFRPDEDSPAVVPNAIDTSFPIAPERGSAAVKLPSHPDINLEPKLAPVKSESVTPVVPPAEVKRSTSTPATTNPVKIENENAIRGKLAVMATKNLMTMPLTPLQNDDDVVE